MAILKYNFSSSVFLNKMDGTTTINDTMAAAQTRNINEIISTYRKRLTGFIRKRVSNAADAEDIVQDVFYQLIGNTQPIEQIAAWLFKVARNKITDRQRKKKPELLEDLFPGSEEDMFFNWSELFFDEKDNPESGYLRSLFWEELNAALNELPEEQKNIFILNEMEGMPFKEIAIKTGVPVPTLISRKRYAVLHLRERLASLREELLNY